MKTMGLSGPSRHAGMTLMETLVSMMIVAILISGTINGYILSTNRADWSAQSLAAHSLALQRLEQVRAATWNVSGEIDVDQVTSANFPEVNSVLDLPVSGTNSVTATIRTTITTVSANPPLKMVRVDCIWPYRNRGLFTNTITTYRAAEQ
jgi:prepilin-type N-terminal cleavage/methylation domain-containing protein